MNQEIFLMKFKILSVFKMHFEEVFYYLNNSKMDEINRSIRHLDKLLKEELGEVIELVYCLGVKYDIKLNRA